MLRVHVMKRQKGHEGSVESYSEFSAAPLRPPRLCGEKRPATNSPQSCTERKESAENELNPGHYLKGSFQSEIATRFSKQRVALSRGLLCSNRLVSRCCHPRLEDY